MALFRILSSTDKLGIQRIDTSSPEPDALGELHASPALSSEEQGRQKLVRAGLIIGSTFFPQTIRIGEQIVTEFTYAEINEKNNSSKSLQKAGSSVLMGNIGIPSKIGYRGNPTLHIHQYKNYNEHEPANWVIAILNEIHNWLLICDRLSNPGYFISSAKIKGKNYDPPSSNHVFDYLINRAKWKWLEGATNRRSESTYWAKVIITPNFQDCKVRGIDAIDLMVWRLMCEALKERMNGVIFDDESFQWTYFTDGNSSPQPTEEIEENSYRKHELLGEMYSWLFVSGRDLKQEGYRRKNLDHLYINNLADYKEFHEKQREVLTKALNLKEDYKKEDYAWYELNGRENCPFCSDDSHWKILHPNFRLDDEEIDGSDSNNADEWFL